MKGIPGGGKGFSKCLIKHGVFRDQWIFSALLYDTPLIKPGSLETFNVCDDPV
jgi:hypothetical protein